MTLALKLLPSLPNLDKDEFIKSYIQTQKAHAKTYATEGRSFSTSWDITPRKPATTSNESRNVGFATPVLEARKFRRATGDASKNETAPGKTTDDIETARASPPTGGRLQRTSQSEEDAKKPSKSKRSREKNRGADSNSDEDRVARLLERRERKRIKRAIMKPKEAAESETASSNGDKRKKRKQAKDEKSKVPAGFALMHGFTATNVGKNRLTRKPPSNVGVFKKGKASFNAKRRQKSKGHRPKPFSELRFLNSKKQSPAGSASESTTSTSDDEPSVTQEPSPKKINAISQKSRTARSFHTLTRGSKPASETAQKKQPDTDSEIWDLESRATEKRQQQRQKQQSLDETSVNDNQETVVIDARIPAWCDQVAKVTTDVEVNYETAAVVVPGALVIPSSPSLRPSESASQIARPVIEDAHAAAVSRYFPANKLDFKPVSKNLKSASSFGHTMESNQEADAILPVDLNQFTAPNNFGVPTCKDVAKQFYSAQVAWSQHQNPFDPPAAGVSETDSPQDLDCCMPPVAAGSLLYESRKPEGIHQIFTRLRSDDPPSIDLETQFHDYLPSIQGQGVVAASPGDERWMDACNNEDFDAFSVQDNIVFAHSEYAAGDDHLSGYSEAEWMLDAQPASVAFDDDNYDSVLLKDEVGEFAPSAENPWQATANSAYLEGDLVEDCASISWDDDDANYSCYNGCLEHGPPAEDVESDCSDPTIINTLHFAQGRTLLGLSPREHAVRTSYAPFNHFSQVEADVVKALRGHWLPQRL